MILKIKNVNIRSINVLSQLFLRIICVLIGSSQTEHNPVLTWNL